MATSIPLSLRGDGPWQGISYESRTAGTSGRFRRLRNFQVSRDGTELQRVPGLKCVARPGYAEGPYFGDLTAGALITDFLASGGPYAGILLQELDIVAKNTVYVRKSASSTSDLPDGWYLSNQGPGPTAEKRASITGGSTVSSAGNSDELYVSRLGRVPLPIHGLIECLQLPVILFEDIRFFDAQAGGTPLYGQGENRSIAALVASKPFSFTAELGPEDFRYWPSMPGGEIIADMTAGRLAANNYVAGGSGDLPYDTRRIPRKAQLSVSDGRVLIGIPGYGCCFQINLKAEILRRANSTFSLEDRVISLGIPQGEFVEASASFVASGTGKYLATHLGFVRVAYYNSKTGEIGQVSDLIEIPAAAGQSNITLTVKHPRWCLRETQADTVLVFTNPPGVNQSAALRLERAVTIAVPAAAVVAGDTTLPQVDDVEGTFPLPVLSKMPMGATWCITLKGQTFYGGRVGSLDDVEAEEADLVRVTDPGSVITVDDPFQVCAKGIPSGYSGIVYNSAQAVIGTARLAKIEGAGGVLPHKQKWNYGGIISGLSALGQRAVLMPKNRVEFSNKDRPEEAPAPQSIIVSRHRGRDVIAAGRYGNSLIMCTDSETYAVSWGSEALGSEAQLIAPSFGCIAPDSMVETELGLFWLSHRGPVVFDGTLQWAGSSVSRRFYEDVRLQDALSEKRYAWTRSRLMWGVRGFFDSYRRTVVWLMRVDEHNSAHEDAALELQVLGATAANPIRVTVGKHGFSLATPFKFEVVNDTERPTLNGEQIGVSVTDTDIEIPAFDNSAGSVNASGSIRFNRDAEQGKVGADQALLLQVDSGSLSTRTWPGDMEWTGGYECTYSDGERRPTLVSSYPQRVSDQLELPGDVFGMDDRYVDRLEETVKTTSPAASDGTDSFTGDVDLRPLLRTRAAVLGEHETSYEAFIRAGTPDACGKYPLYWWGRIASVDGTTGTVVTLESRDSDQLADGPLTATWPVGAVMEIGVIHAEAVTTNLTVRDLPDQGKRGKISARGLTLQHAFGKTASGADGLAWAFVESYGDGRWTRARNSWGQQVGVNDDITEIAGAASVGHEIAVRVVVISNVQCRLKDILLGIGQ